MQPESSFSGVTFGNQLTNRVSQELLVWVIIPWHFACLVMGEAPFTPISCGFVQTLGIWQVQSGAACPIWGPDYMRQVRTLTGTTEFTWPWSESMKWLHEIGVRLQIGMNVYMKHAGSFYFSFVVCFIIVTLDEKWIYPCLQTDQMYCKFRALYLKWICTGK